MQTDELKILLAVEPKWTVSLNGREFLALPSSEIRLQDSTILIGKYTRKIMDVEWLRPNAVRLKTRKQFSSLPDVITLYPGGQEPRAMDLRRRRRAFQARLTPALGSYFGRAIERQTLFSDRRYGIGGAYPRFLIGKQAVIAADPDDSSAVVNAVMRAAILWSPMIRRRLSVVVPLGRQQTIVSRLRVMPQIREAFEWLQWDGESLSPLSLNIGDPETYVQQFHRPDVDAEVSRLLQLAPGLLQAVPDIAARGISVRLRGLELARVCESETVYPLGEPLEQVILEVDAARRYRSLHPLARAHEERWLESNLIGRIGQVLPSVDPAQIYPQVPSFVGEERGIIDLLTVTRAGRLVVIEIKASADPDLPFQALDYWIAVERHRKAGDFNQRGYFAGRVIEDTPALLVLAAPLLAYHKTLGRMISVLPQDLPVVEIGLNQTWKREIKVLRRRGYVG